MTLRERAHRAAEEVNDALSPPLTEEQMKQVAEIVENAMTAAINETSLKSRDAALTCCSADRDMAHKIEAEIELAKKALLANLMSLR